MKDDHSTSSSVIRQMGDNSTVSLATAFKKHNPPKRYLTVNACTWLLNADISYTINNGVKSDLEECDQFPGHQTAIVFALNCSVFTTLNAIQYPSHIYSTSPANKRRGPEYRRD